jgi:hypothetical protein
MKYLLITIIGLFTCISLIQLNCKRAIPQIDTKSYCDSIADMNFEYEIRLNRYELTLGILREENPKLASEFEEIMSTQTE